MASTRAGMPARGIRFIGGRSAAQAVRRRLSSAARVRGGDELAIEEKRHRGAVGVVRRRPRPFRPLREAHPRAARAGGTRGLLRGRQSSWRRQRLRVAGRRQRGAGLAGAGHERLRQRQALRRQAQRVRPGAGRANSEFQRRVRGQRSPVQVQLEEGRGSQSGQCAGEGAVGIEPHSLRRPEWVARGEGRLVRLGIGIEIRADKQRRD